MIYIYYYINNHIYYVINILLYILRTRRLKRSRITTTTSHSLLPIAPSFVNKRRSWCCVSCSFLVEESNSAPAIAGATSHGSGATLNVGSRFLTIPGNPGKPLFCARFTTHTLSHTREPTLIRSEVPHVHVD